MGRGLAGLSGCGPPPRPRPRAPDTVAARPWWDGVDEDDVVFGEAGVPETECLVNTDVS